MREMGHNLGKFFRNRTTQGIPASDQHARLYRPKDRSDWLSTKFGILGDFPVIGDWTSVANAAEMVYNVGKQLTKDQLRMQPEHKTDTPQGKINYMAEYFLENYDPGQVEAKKAYHIRRGIRMLNSAAIDLLMLGANMFVMSHVGGYADITGHIPLPFNVHLPLIGSRIDVNLADSVRNYFIFDGVKNALLGVREGSETRNLSTRTTIGALNEKMNSAIDYLGLQGDKNYIRKLVHQQLDEPLAARFRRHDSFTKDDHTNLSKRVRRVEWQDWRVENRGRPLALVSRLTLRKRLFPLGLLSRDEMLQKRDNARAKGVHYEPAYGEYVYQI